MEKSINTHTSLHDNQGAISTLNPDLLLNSMITSISPEAGGGQSPEFMIPTVTGHPSSSPFPRMKMESVTDTAPLTIFYNGTVTVFDLSNDKAENIIKFAERAAIPKIIDPSDTTAMAVALLDTLNEDLPIARKKSLQRFLEKRKERFTSVSPLTSTRNPRF